ncbi:MAG TPA: Na+/H+ antiporter subunit G [Ramlibacter sp.]|nr:Na+/H+ antiporter subunit G [Ramlibacter sp.]
MGAVQLPWLLEAAVSFALVVGGAFILVGAIGFARFRDFFMRLHAPTKASTLGVGSILVASLLWHWGQGQWALRELLITLFVFVTAPVSANLLAEAALHLKVRSRVPPPQDFGRQ